MEPNCEGELDFQILFDDKEYWRVCYLLIKRIEKFEKLPKYPLKCNYFVAALCYGVDFIIVIPKEGFPKQKTQVRLMNISSFKQI